METEQVASCDMVIFWVPEGPPACISPVVSQITLRNVSIGLSIIFSGSLLPEVIALSGVKVY